MLYPTSLLTLPWASLFRGRTSRIVAHGRHGERHGREVWHWRVSPVPGPTARPVWMALLSLSDGEPDVTWGWRELFRLAGLTPSGRTQQQAVRVLESLRDVRLDCDKAVVTPDGMLTGELRLIESLDVSARTARLARWITDPLKGGQGTPLDHPTWIDLENSDPVASRLFEVLTAKLQFLPTWEVGYRFLCSMLPVVPEQDTKRALEALSAAVGKLAKFGYSFEWHDDPKQLARVNFLRQRQEPLQQDGPDHFAPATQSSGRMTPPDSRPSPAGISVDWNDLFPTWVGGADSEVTVRIVNEGDSPWDGWLAQRATRRATRQEEE